MAVTRFKLPFGKMPPKFNDKGVEQWRDYCAVSEVNSDKPNDIVLIDLALTGLSKFNATKAVDVSEAKEADLTAFGITAATKVGLPEYYTGK